MSNRGFRQVLLDSERDEGQEHGPQTPQEAALLDSLFPPAVAVTTSRLKTPQDNGLADKVLADTLDVSFIWVSPRHINTPNAFAEILTLARFVAPTVLFLEDLDLFASDRETHTWMGLGELMNQLDGALDNEDLITIATTNRLEVIERALRNRPGRFDRIVCFEPMDEPCRRTMLNRLLSRATISADDLAHLIAATDRLTGAQMQEIVNTIFLLAVEQRSAEPPADAPRPNLIQVNRALIDAAVAEVRVARQGGLGFRAD